MTEQITVTISKPVFERLQGFAAPLVDTTDTVIGRLLDYWEVNSNNRTMPTGCNSTVTQELWRSSRGDTLPVGTELRGTYLGKTFSAQVERTGIRFEGKIYNNLSPAAMAAKNLVGTKGKAANTNGRDFWKFQDSTTGQWIPVSVLRPSHRIDSDKLLAELEKI
jgi:hypothetical protein